MKPCRRCGGTDRYASGKCRPRHLVYTGCRYRERPDICARGKLERHYLLDRQQAQVALVNAQGGLCDACGGLHPLDVDHAHAVPKRGNGWSAYRTGPARGMLCRGCNQVAGLLERGRVSRSPKASKPRWPS